MANHAMARVIFFVSMLLVARPVVAAEEPVDDEILKALADDQATTQAAGGDTSVLAPGGALSVARNVTPLTNTNPNMSFILDTTFGWYSDEAHLTQGGHSPDDNGVSLQGLELAVSGTVDPFFRFDMNMQLFHLHVEEAYLTTLALPLNLQARAGYFNAQFGRQNAQHLHVWKFVNPPLIQNRFMSEEHFSGAGAEVSVLLPLPWYVVLIGQGFSTAPALNLRSSSFASVDYSSSGTTDGLEDFVYVARLEQFFALGDDWSLYVGLDGAWGQSPYVPDNMATLYGGDVYLKWRPISSGNDAMAIALTMEYMVRDTQVPGDSVRDHGFYAQLDAQIDRFWLFSLRGDYTDLVSGTSPDQLAIPGLQWRGSLAATWMPTHFSKVRLQYDVGWDEGYDTVYHAGFLQLEVSAGSHGAHTF